MNKELLRREIDLIKNEALRAEVERIVESIPECMEHKPASSSGKHHPDFDNVDGGLVNHTRAVVRVMQTLIEGLSGWDYSFYIKKDWMYSACILHDLMKYGTDPDNTDTTVFNHPILAGELIEEKYPRVATLIKSHMGKWNVDTHTDMPPLPTPTTYMEKLVHMADHIASQKWVSEKILE